MAQRRVWIARAELALAQGNPLLAVEIVDRLFAAQTENEAQVIGAVPYLAKVRGEGLVALRRWDEAEAIFQSALATAEAQATPRFVWSLHLALGKLYQAQRRTADAAQAFVAARGVIDEIAASVSDLALRDNFVRQATRLMPESRPRSPLQIARESAGGLTRREREVALLIAQGKSNRAIAERLILSERTVEDYVTHILAKLGFSARTQIAAWVVEKGLSKDDK